MGAIGCLARWSVEEVVERQDLAHRAYATMAVNVFGSLIAGFVAYGAMRGSDSPGSAASWLQSAQPWLLTGFCGGFTTYSSAIAIPYLDYRGGRRSRGVWLIAGTLALCLIGFWFGDVVLRLF
jgi:CrcB protein